MINPCEADPQLTKIAIDKCSVFCCSVPSMLPLCFSEPRALEVDPSALQTVA